jgi:DNA helicase-2/ATP-dependent DNA helicase PcrA
VADRRYTLSATQPRAPVPSLETAGALNPEQIAVVRAGPGPLLVIAGAGSGKTRTLIYRVAHLIHAGMPAESILLMTFTNRAAREMMKRVGDLVRTDVRRMVGGTFHHVANLVLREHARLLGYGPNFGILDREDARDLLDAVVGEVGVQPATRRFPKGDVLASLLSYTRNTQSPLEHALARRWPQFLPLADLIREVARRYAERKVDANVMDFDDLLFFWKVLLSEHPPVREALGRRFRYVLVDEYQDTNALQADIVDLLVSSHRNVLVVGDDAQSIYSFRGATFENILGFPERYPDAQVFRLTWNYRSTPEILALANRSIAHNRRGFPKELRAVKGSGARPALVACRDVYQQAEFVAQRLLELRDEGIPLSEMAVLYRAHSQSLELQLELTRRNIPYTVRSGLRFFEQAHIKDVLAHLRLVHNPRDELAWMRALKLLPAVGTVTAEKVWLLVKGRSDPIEALGDEAVQGSIPRRARESVRRLRDLLAGLAEIGRDHPADLIAHVLRSGYDRYLATTYDDAAERIEDIEQLASYALSFGGLEELLSELSLLASFTAEHVMLGGDLDEVVTLSSVHQAKGLEWRAVFVVWLCDGRFPSSPALRDPDGDEEERRLFYVACTRAKDELYLCYPLVHRSYDTDQVLLSRSRFVDEIGAGDPPYERWEIEEAPAPRVPGATPALAVPGPEDPDDVDS